MTRPFTTAGMGIVPGGGGDVDNTVRRQAWEQAHPGGTIGHEVPGEPAYTARWPDGSVAATAFASLAALMVKLDRAEAGGRCPVHEAGP